MKTQTAIIAAFDDAQERLEKHGVSIRSNGKFGLFIGDKLIAMTETVDGLTAFADGLDFAASSGEVGKQ